MCKFEKSGRANCAEGEKQKKVMGLKSLGDAKAEKSRPQMKLWMIRATTTMLLWTCVMQLTALGEMWGPRVLKGWPACFTPSDSSLAVKSSVAERIVLPPKRVYKNNGYLMVSCNGGLNQMRAAVVSCNGGLNQMRAAV